MRVWTVQAAARLDVARWPLRSSARFVDPYMQPAYRWMARALTLRVGAPPRGASLPLWAWPVKPDLRGRAWLPPGTPGVRLTLEVPEAALLASDFDRFHAVLNRHYLETSRADSDRFEHALVRTPRWPHTLALRARIEASWARVFTLDAASLVQVVFWQLRRDQVVRVERFVAR